MKTLASAVSVIALSATGMILGHWLVLHVESPTVNGDSWTPWRLHDLDDVVVSDAH